MQEVTKAILEKLGHTGFIAGTGFQALEMLASASYDLILMDIRLPDIDGFEVTRKFRKKNQLTPIIAFTQESGAGVEEELLAAGMNGRIAKPFEPADFHAMLKAVFSNQ